MDPSGVNVELIRTIGLVLGVFLAIPLLVVLAKVVMFMSDLKNLATNTAQTLTNFTDRIDRILESHDSRISDTEHKVGVLWDGYERRSGSGRRAGEIID